MVMDHKWDDWTRKYVQPVTPPSPYQPFVTPPLPTPAEIDEFRRLLERAREYDKRNNEPDCELESKRQKLRDLADMLGVKIDFV
jgi:hypothetical protein